MLIDRGLYEDTIRAIIALCPGIRAIDENNMPVFQARLTTNNSIKFLDKFYHGELYGKTISAN